MISLFHLSAQPRKIAVLDGVRAFACFSVISYHVHYLLSHVYNFKPIFGALAYDLALAGWSGVTLFFVLSGFLLFMPYAKALLFEQSWPSWRTFYLRRALRILPGYYLALFLLIMLSHREYLAFDHVKNLAVFMTLLMDSFHRTYQQIDGPFWTLAVEWQYYMLLPLIALGFSFIVRLGRSFAQRLTLVIVCLLGMIAWGGLSCVIGTHYMMYPKATLLVPRPVLNVFLALIYGQSGKYYGDFAVGMLVSTLYIASRNAAPVSTMTQFLRRHYRWFWGCGMTLLFFMCTWYVFPWKKFLTPALGPHALLVEPGFALGFGLCVLALLFSSGIYKRVLSWRPICQFGDISYSLYIWHLPILLLFKSVVLDNMPGLGFWHSYGLYWLCVTVAIIPFAFLFYRFVEVPGINLAHRNRQKEARARMQVATLVDKASSVSEVVDVSRDEVVAGRTALVKDATSIRKVRLVMYDKSLPYGGR